MGALTAKTEAMLAACAALKSADRSVHAMAERLEAIKRNTAGMGSVYDGVCGRIGGAEQGIGESRLTLHSMAQALERSCELYAGCEKSVINNLENGRKKAIRPGVIDNEIKDSWMNQIIY